MTKASDNAYPSILVEEHVDPAAPAAGHKRLFIDTDHKLKSIDSSSVVVDFTPTAVLLNKYDATVAPAVTDDSGDGYAVGSIWIDVTADKAYIAVDVTVGAAVWNTPPAVLLNKYNATVAPAVTDDSGDGYAVGSIWVDVTGDDAYICVDATVGAAVWNPFETAGGTGPALYLPATVTPHATYGDDFQGTLAKWTAFGSHNSAADIIAHTGYADYVLRLREQGGGGLYQALPAGDCRLTLIVSGCTTYVSAHMLGVGVWTSGGDGVAYVSYTDGKDYCANISGGIYTGNSANVPNNRWSMGTDLNGSQCVWTMQMDWDESEKKIRGRSSPNGGRDFTAWSSWSDAFGSTATRMGIVKVYPNSNQAEVFEVYWFNYEAI